MNAVKQISRAKTVPQEDAIKKLEEILEKARKGYVYSVIILAEDRDGGISRSHSIDSRNALRLIGGLEAMKDYLLRTFVSNHDT